jgi:hypothetical protein
MRIGPYFIATCIPIFFSFSLPGSILLAEDQDKPAVAPLPRTINLTEEQRHIIKENVKDMSVPKARSSAPETIGDEVPPDIKLSQLPPLAVKKVAQARSHLFFVKQGGGTIVLVSPDDRRISDVIH